ncbi:putative quinol monooxygenase [Paenibacillus sp. IHBB 10380]|uniref:putative quinol monooxygenase n=1 Tax=Paenibacillus sp. IHBB 10380 TaxID=1566358 RepID=UPI0005CFB52D|nr:putative quinol monooxygenase [Paenibacillus sp. IHBB 10380]AJS61037.1 monooxygenase [Paenibacillus sp. IHBB 10380]
MIIIHATFNVIADKHQAFIEEIQPLLEVSRAETGNISYDLFKSTDKDNIFTMVEVWQDADAVASHNASTHFTSFVGKAGNFLAAPLDVKSFDGQAIY